MHNLRGSLGSDGTLTALPGATPSSQGRPPSFLGGQNIVIRMPPRRLSAKRLSADKPKRVYFAHAVCVYGSEEEKTQLAQIRKRLRPDIVFNPAEYQNHPEKRIDSMSFLFQAH